MLLFLPIIFSIMYKVLLEAFNRGLSTVTGKTFNAFPFLKDMAIMTILCFYPQTSKSIYGLTEWFIFPFLVFYITTPRLLSSKLANRTISQNLSWILNTRNVAHAAIFTVQETSERRSWPQLEETGFTFFLIFSWDSEHMWQQTAMLNVSASVRMSNFISSHGSPSGHLTVGGRAR